MKQYFFLALKQTLSKYFIYAFFFGLIPVLLTSKTISYVIENFIYIGFLKGVSEVGSSPLDGIMNSIIPSSKPLLSILFLYASIHLFLLSLGFTYRFIRYLILNWKSEKFKYHQVKRFSRAYQCYSNLMKRLIPLSDFIFEVLCSITGAYFTYILLNQTLGDYFHILLKLFLIVFILLYIKRILENFVIIQD